MKAAVLLAFVLAFLPRIGAREISISVPAARGPVAYGTRMLAAACEAHGDSLRAVAPGQPADIVVATGDTHAGTDGYALRPRDGSLLISGGDERGAMYGLLEVAEQVRRGTAVASIQAHEEQARVAFRGIKFNLPFAAYRTGPVIEQHQETVSDPAFWESFLDMMARNRFNALTLWSLHPFHYLTVPKDFPEAQTFSDADLRRYRALFQKIFALAKERGIETYLISWNTFVSPAFAAAHHLATYSLEWRHFGNGVTDPIVAAYTRECVQQVIDEYPDLTGVGTTLGERMGGQSPAERREWLDQAFIAGIQSAHRPVKFIYRAPLSADTKSGGTTSEENDRLTRAQIESLGGNVTRPVYVEFKFNWSHGHSSPQLFIVHGGKLSDAYWNPVSPAIRALWTVRNEDFFVLRWGQPDFIREFVSRNSAAWASGALIGSEAYIPAKDYISLDGPWKSGRYAFERQWLFYAMWGRLLYNPATPDAEFAAQLGDRFGTRNGTDLLRAWQLASRAPLRFAAFHQGRADGTLYTEAFSAWGDRGTTLRFFDINQFIGHPVLDPAYVNIRDFVRMHGQVPAGVTSPLALATELDRDADAANELEASVRARGNVPPTLAAELADLDAWNAFAHYFAAKLRGGVALETFRATGDVAKQREAVQQLTAAAADWRQLAEAGSRFNKEDVLFHTFAPMSWKRLQPEVDHDIEIGRSATK